MAGHLGLEEAWVRMVQVQGRALGREVEDLDPVIGAAASAKKSPVEDQVRFQRELAAYQAPEEDRQTTFCSR